MRERGALLKLEPGSGPGAEPAAARWRRTRTLRAPTVEPRAELAPRMAVVRAPRAARSRLRAAAGALLAGLAGLAAWRWLGSDDSFAERLSQGCEQLEPCRQLEAEAARREQSCWLGCGRELSDHRMARLLRYRAEERSAVREHYRQRDDAERSEQQLEREQKLADWQREQAAHSAEAEREQRERLELERLRQDRIDQRLQAERQRRISYLALLAPAARAERLEQCYVNPARAAEGAAPAQAGHGPAGCEALVLDLVEAAAESAEKRKLAELNEKLLHGGGAAPRAPAAKPPATTPNS
jgi:hypothetical protein